MENARERLTTVLQSELPEVEPPVVFPIVVANHAARVAGERLRRALTDGRILAEILYHAYQFYNYDLIMVFGDVLIEAEAMGSEFLYPEDDLPILSRPRWEKVEDAVQGLKEGFLLLVLPF
ncbi:MAG: uroporphyrinogen decarboxylase family protein [bacterium]